MGITSMTNGSQPLTKVKDFTPHCESLFGLIEEHLGPSDGWFCRDAETAHTFSCVMLVLSVAELASHSVAGSDCMSEMPDTSYANASLAAFLKPRAKRCSTEDTGEKASQGDKGGGDDGFWGVVG